MSRILLLVQPLRFVDTVPSLTGLQRLDPAYNGQETDTKHKSLDHKEEIHRKQSGEPEANHDLKEALLLFPRNKRCWY